MQAARKAFALADTLEKDCLTVNEGSIVCLFSAGRLPADSSPISPTSDRPVLGDNSRTNSVSFVLANWLGEGPEVAELRP